MGYGCVLKHVFTFQMQPPFLPAPYVGTQPAELYVQGCPSHMLLSSAWQLIEFEIFSRGGSGAPQLQSSGKPQLLRNLFAHIGDPCTSWSVPSPRRANTASVWLPVSSGVAIAGPKVRLKP